MDWYNLDEITQQTVLFPHKTTQCLKATTHDQESGGIINHGKWAWLAHKNQLEIVSLENGQNISVFDFTKLQGYEAYEISCVEEIFARDNKQADVLLAIILQSCTEDRSCVLIYSVEDSDIILSLQLAELLTAAHFVQFSVLSEDLSHYYDGCLAVGNRTGCVYLLNLNLQKSLENASKQIKDCQIIDISSTSNNKLDALEICMRDEKHFALQLTAQSECMAVTCILAVEIIQGLIIGFEDGSISLFDFSLLHLIYTLNPAYERRNVPVVKLCFLLPLDDPTPCFYLWAIYKEEQHMEAIMHALTYHNYKVDKNNRSSLKNLRKMQVCLEVQLEAEECCVLGFQTISTISALNEEDGSSLCMISWYNLNKTVNKILLFDLNQWYKEEMPKIVNSRGKTRFLAGFILNTQGKGEHVYLDGNTISHFNSLHREEEHFYPNALSFNVQLLQRSACRIFSWDGLQNRVIHKFRSSNASIFLETEKYYNEILCANLLPQFNDLNGSSGKTLSPLIKKYETMLSFALEYNCCSLIRDCVSCWSDGSFSGNLGIKTGLSLNVIVNWLCKRADCIENRCKYLCKGLLESNEGYALDQREQRELSTLIRQLKLLKDVASDIVNKSKNNNNENLSGNLKKKLNVLKASDFFYPVVLWLFNIGILPTSALPYAANFSYNFKELERFFRERRAYLKEFLPSNKHSHGKSKTVHLLFIDAFIQQASHNDELTTHWKAIGGNGLYPPPTLSAMLDILMLPDLELESKTILLLYLFLDLHAALEHVPACKAVLAQLVKFPTVFQINANLIKLVQTFWFIDHANFAQANIDEFLTIIKQNHKKEWLLDLLLQILVTQNESELALRIFQASPTLISPALKLKTLLANDLITEAFQIARSERILEVFFEYCISKGKYSIIRDLALNEAEGAILLRLLKNCKEYCAENLQFVYLLSRSKYIEAVAYMDELSKKKGLQPKQKGVIENSNLVLSAFNTTMAPMAQGLTDIYFRIHNKLKHKEVENNAPLPLSCQLIKQNANTLLGGMYHSSVLSAHFATHYLNEMNKEMLYSDNVPFLRKPQLEAYPMDPERQYKVSMPKTYKGNIKRTLAHDHSSDSNAAQENPQKRRKLGLQIIEDLTLKHGTSANELAEQKRKLHESLKNMEANKKSSIKTNELESGDAKKPQKNVNFFAETEDSQIPEYWTVQRNMASDYTSETLNRQNKEKEKSVEKQTSMREVHRKEITTTIDSVIEEESEAAEEMTTTKEEKQEDEDEEEEAMNMQKSAEISKDTGISSLHFNLQPRKPLSQVSLTKFSTAGNSDLYKTALTSLTTVLTEIKTSEFGPKVCSTTVADGETKLSAEERKSQIIYTECTTVIDDTETYTELSLKNATPETVEKSNVEHKLHSLETTLDWEDNSISANNSKEEEQSMTDMEFYNTASEIDISQLNESKDNNEKETEKVAEEIISLDDDDDDDDEDEDDDVEVIENRQEVAYEKEIVSIRAEEEIISLEDDSSDSHSNIGEVLSSECEDESHGNTTFDEEEAEEEEEEQDMMMINEEQDMMMINDDTSNEQQESYSTESEIVDDVDLDEIVNMPIHADQPQKTETIDLESNSSINLEFSDSLQKSTIGEENSNDVEESDTYLQFVDDNMQFASNDLLAENPMFSSQIIISNVVSLKAVEETTEKLTTATEIVTEKESSQILPENQSSEINSKSVPENQSLIPTMESVLEIQVSQQVNENVSKNEYVTGRQSSAVNSENIPRKEADPETQLSVSKTDESFDEAKDESSDTHTRSPIKSGNELSVSKNDESFISTTSINSVEMVDKAKDNSSESQSSPIKSENNSTKEAESENQLSVSQKDESFVSTTSIYSIEVIDKAKGNAAVIQASSIEPDNITKNKTEPDMKASDESLDEAKAEPSKTQTSSPIKGENISEKEAESVSKKGESFGNTIEAIDKATDKSSEKVIKAVEIKEKANISEDANSSTEILLSVSNTMSDELNESSDMNTSESVGKLQNRKRSASSQRTTKKEENSVQDSLARRRQSKRGISVPPQVMVETKSNLNDGAYSTNRKYRATSLQPREYVDSPTPLKRTKSNRGSAAYLNELSPNFDSPSQNTRSRRRLLSEDNESDISIVSDAQTNNSSKSRPRSRASTVKSELRQTPRGRKRRAASVMDNEDNETNDSKEEEMLNKKGKETTHGAPLEQRRLTRHQLAILEKANANTAAYAASQKTDDTESLKSTSSRRVTRGSLKNMNKDQLDDDVMSVSSLASSTNSKRRTRGRATPKNLSTIPENN